MKELKKLKLKDIVKTPMDVSEMDNLVAGINDGVMPAAYGCHLGICTTIMSTYEHLCTTEVCETAVCYTGV